MKEFMMLFRTEEQVAQHQPTPEEIQAEIKLWQDWIGGIAAQGKFVTTQQLTQGGKVLQPDGVVTDGPYVEVKEILGGFLIVKAADYEEALEMAKGCPVRNYGGTVEVRDFVQLPSFDA